MIQEWLYKTINDVNLGVDLLYFKLFLCYELPDVILPHLNMLRLSMINRISDEVDCAL